MRNSRIVFFTAVALAIVVLAAGCGGDDNDSTSESTTPTSQQETTPAAGGAASQVTVKMDEYEFEPSDVTVKRGGTITVDNEGKIAHNLTVERGESKVAGTSTFLPPKSDSVKVDLKPGRYKIVCTVPGHAQLGMKGTLTVK